MHHFDIDFRIKNQNTKKPSYNDIIETIVNIWYDEKIITQNEIIKSFKVTGISNKLDGSENNMVIKNDELCDTIIDPETIIKNKDFLEQENIKKTTINK